MTEMKLTPMMKQYQQVKSEIPDDAVLLFRLGDFYEMFFDDAKKAAPVLDITLTKRGGVPMCGVPFHALNNYLPRLLDAGIKVAIAEQIEDPKQAKGIVKRAVSRIITPGTIIDSAALQPGQNNFLLALYVDKYKYGLASIDISTGEFKTTELNSEDELVSELHRLDAQECLLPESVYNNWSSENCDFPETGGKICWTALDDWIFSPSNAEEYLLKHFSVASLDGFGCGNITTAIASAGAVLYYASENLRKSATHVKTLKTYQSGNYMILDATTKKNLELVEPMSGAGNNATLLKTLNFTETAMGLRMLREWVIRPQYNKDNIIARLDAVETFLDDSFGRTELRETLIPVRDIERIITRINLGSANARDMLALADSLKIIPVLKGILDCYDMPLLCSLNNALDNFNEIVNKISSIIVDDPPLNVTDGGIIKEGIDDELDELRRAAKEGRNWIAQMQQTEQEKTGIKALKIRYNRVFGYYIEVSKSNVHLVPENYIRKQTLANGERYITDELKKIENKILGADEKSKALEYKIFKSLRDETLNHTEKIQKTAKSVATIDVLQSFAQAASKYNYCRPKLTNDKRFVITQGRHPVLDASMSVSGERFVPNDVNIDGESQLIMIITGPNMAGKSTYIRQVALLALMTHMGCFIPAESAEIGLIDRIFTRVGAADDISRGQSTFMVEMLETANILNHATNKSLVILDEIGRGTSTFDGISIAWAIAEYLHDNKRTQARTLFATHYHELTELAITKKRIRNYNVAVREYGDKIIFLRQIVQGTSDKSYGIHVGRLAGLPEPVINRAKEILENLETNAIAEAGMPALAIHHEKNDRRLKTQIEKIKENNAESKMDNKVGNPEINIEIEVNHQEPAIIFPDNSIFQPSLFD